MSEPEQNKACRDVARALAMCMLETECMKSGNTLSQCLKRKETEDCQVFDVYDMLVTLHV